MQIALRDPKMLQRIAEFGGTPLSLTAPEFGKLVVGRDRALGQGGGEDRAVDRVERHTSSRLLSLSPQSGERVASEGGRVRGRFDNTPLPCYLSP